MLPKLILISFINLSFFFIGKYSFSKGIEHRSSIKVRNLVARWSKPPIIFNVIVVFNLQCTFTCFFYYFYETNIFYKLFTSIYLLGAGLV